MVLVIFITLIYTSRRRESERQNLTWKSFFAQLHLRQKTCILLACHRWMEVSANKWSEQKLKLVKTLVRNLYIFNASWQCAVASYNQARSFGILLFDDWRELHFDVFDLWRNEEDLWIAKLNSQKGYHRRNAFLLFHISFAFSKIFFYFCLYFVSKKINFDFFQNESLRAQFLGHDSTLL